MYEPTVRLLKIVYGGILGETSDLIGEALVKEIMDTLKRSEAEVVLFDHVRVDSPVYHCAVTLPGYLWRTHLPVHNWHWKLDLPNSFDEFCRNLSGNSRQNIRRYSRKLLRAFGESVTIRCFQHEKEIDRLIRDVEKVAAKTYQRGLGVALSDDSETRRKIRLGLQRQWFRVYVLYIDNEPRAFWPGFSYRRTFFIGTPGYDPDYSSYRTGQFLHMKMIEEFCNDKTTEAVDYGFGDAQYKRSYCNQSWREASLYFFAPTLKGLKLNAARTATIGISQFAKSVLDRTGFLTKAKRVWRKHLTPEK
jgi:hypothetical protein